MANETDKFIISSYTINRTETADVTIEPDIFPGNISPEGYFYSPFYEVNLKELDDELQSIPVRRINFVPSGASVLTSTVTFYNPEFGTFSDDSLYIIKITSPVNYDFTAGQPFVIYDVMKDRTYRGFLEDFSGTTLKIATSSEIVASLLNGQDGSGKSAYIISLMEENAPEYAEYIPSTQRLVWRGPKKMSDLSSDSPLYNMPFSNGRLYIHKNLNVFVRRQDPHGGYKLFKPSDSNPLKKYQVSGKPKLDFDYIQEIIDSMVDAC